MDVVVAYAIAALGVGWWGATLRGRLRRNRRARQAVANFDGDAQVALALARHEASTRHQPLDTYHLAYALVQSDPVAGAIRIAGGDPDAIEARIVAALDRAATGSEAAPGTPPPAAHERAAEAATAIAFAGAIALEHHHRQATVTDLWARLVRTSAAPLLADGDATPLAVLFVLAHGLREPPVTLAGEREVQVVLRNDDFTTRELVIVLLEQEFGLTTAEATALMQAANDTGVARIGRFPAEAARAKIEAARARARDAGYPLWLGVEAC